MLLQGGGGEGTTRREAPPTLYQSLTPRDQTLNIHKIYTPHKTHPPPVEKSPKFLTYATIAHILTHMKQTPTLQGKRRRNFYLPDSLMAEVEAIAVKRETTTTDILRRALEAYVRAWKAKHVN